MPVSVDLSPFFVRKTFNFFIRPSAFIAATCLLFVQFLLFSQALEASTYVGDRNSFGRFHGKGTYTTSNGTSFVGDWVNGEKSGKGTQICLMGINTLAIG